MQYTAYLNMTDGIELVIKSPWKSAESELYEFRCVSNPSVLHSYYDYEATDIEMGAQFTICLCV